MFFYRRRDVTMNEINYDDNSTTTPIKKTKKLDELISNFEKSTTKTDNSSFEYKKVDDLTEYLLGHLGSLRGIGQKKFEELRQVFSQQNGSITSPKIETPALIKLQQEISLDQNNIQKTRQQLRNHLQRLKSKQQLDLLREMKIKHEEKEKIKSLLPKSKINENEENIIEKENHPVGLQDDELQDHYSKQNQNFTSFTETLYDVKPDSSKILVSTEPNSIKDEDIETLYDVKPDSSKILVSTEPNSIKDEDKILDTDLSFSSNQNKSVLFDNFSKNNSLYHNNDKPLESRSLKTDIDSQSIEFSEQKDIKTVFTNTLDKNISYNSSVRSNTTDSIDHFNDTNTLDNDIVTNINPYSRSCLINNIFYIFTVLFLISGFYFYPHTHEISTNSLILSRIEVGDIDSSTSFSPFSSSFFLFVSIICVFLSLIFFYWIFSRYFTENRTQSITPLDDKKISYAKKRKKILNSPNTLTITRNIVHVMSPHGKITNKSDDTSNNVPIPRLNNTFNNTDSVFSENTSYKLARKCRVCSFCW